MLEIAKKRAAALEQMHCSGTDRVQIDADRYGQKHEPENQSSKLMILEGLAKAIPTISQDFLYDDRGSELYTQIVEQQEYYLPKAEAKLMQQHQDSIVQFGPSSRQATQVVIELGAGDGQRTVPFVGCMAKRTAATIYVPCDISPAALEWNRMSFEQQFYTRPELSIQPCPGTHDESLRTAACIDGIRTYMFMGSSLGNLTNEEILDFFSMVGSRMSAQDRFLLGVDRAHGEHKPKVQIEKAYNDAAGVTAAFTLNILSCVNRLAGLDFCESGWKHVAEYDEESRSILTHVEAVRPQSVHNENGQLLRTFEQGDRIFVERSVKFELSDISRLAEEAGLVATRHWSSNDYLIVELRFDLYKQWLSCSQQLFMETIGADRLLERPIQLRNPYAFYLGHNAAFADIHQLQLRGSRAGYYRKHFERGIDPDVDDPSKCHAHSELPVEWPSARELVEYETDVCNALKEQWLQSGAIHSESGLMSIEHTMMHHETLLYMVAEDEAAVVPLDVASDQEGPPQTTVALVVGGDVQLGASDAERVNSGFLWDNEGPAFTVNVPSFLVHSHAVTNAQFRSFVEDNGYAEEQYWASPEECCWAQKTLHSKPLRWQWHGDAQSELTIRTPVSGCVDMSAAAHWPVHVTLAEAMAYCRWLGHGARVMREDEYHMIFKAAARDAGSTGPLTTSSTYRRSAINGNNNFKHMVPTRVGIMNDAPSESMQIFDLVGNGWEWTSSTFAPFEGFEPMPSYPGYSADFFDGKHSVCLGASMFTNLQLARPSFRNWFQSRYPHVIAKFRVVYDFR